MWKENPIRLGFKNTYQGGQITGFQFRFTPSGTRGIYASMLSGGFSVKVDGVSYPTDRISLKFGDKTIQWAQIDNANDLFVEYGEAITVIVESQGGLKDGMHKVEMGYTTGWGSSWNDDPELDEYFDFLPPAQRATNAAMSPAPRLSVISSDLVLVM